MAGNKRNSMTLQFLQNTSVSNMADTLISLAAAFILGGLIGFERQYRQRTAGLRTNVLVALGAAIFVDFRPKRQEGQRAGGPDHALSAGAEKCQSRLE